MHDVARVLRCPRVRLKFGWASIIFVSAVARDHERSGNLLAKFVTTEHMLESETIGVYPTQFHSFSRRTQISWRPLDRTPTITSRTQKCEVEPHSGSRNNLWMRLLHRIWDLCCQEECSKKIELICEWSATDEGRLCQFFECGVPAEVVRIVRYDHAFSLYTV